MINQSYHHLHMSVIFSFLVNILNPNNIKYLHFNEMHSDQFFNQALYVFLHDLSVCTLYFYMIQLLYE